MAALTSKLFASRISVGTHGSTSESCFPHRKVARITIVCQQSPLISSSTSQKVETGKSTLLSQEGVVTMIQSSSVKYRSRWWGPLFNLPAEDWLDVLPSNENLNEVHHNVVGSALKQRQRPVIGSEVNSLPELAVGVQQEVPLKNISTFSRTPVKFTADKARLLRKKMRASETWHDGMYHSAIASKLANPEK